MRPSRGVLLKRADLGDRKLDETRLPVGARSPAPPGATSRDLVDVRLVNGVIAAIGPDVRPEEGDEVIDARGGALLPGLHDHHLHLAALAAASAFPS